MLIKYIFIHSAAVFANVMRIRIERVCMRGFSEGKIKQANTLKQRINN